MPGAAAGVEEIVAAVLCFAADRRFERMQQQQMNVCTDVLQRGIDEGRVPADDDQQVLLTFLIGPLLMAGLTGNTELNDAFAERLTNHFLAAIQPVAAR